MAIGCSSSSRTGYTYYDDVYDNRPSYSEDKRRSANVDDRPTYQESTPTYNNSTENYENRRYIDDESSSSNYNGSYSDRIRRFSGSNSGFDYYSPYYSGYNDGFSSGFGMSSGFGYGGYGSYRPSIWNPFYSSSIYFGWGRPSIGFGYNSWITPSYYNSYNYYNPWDWGNSWYSPYHSSSYWGGNHHNYDRNPIKNNSYYGPRGGSYGNTYYNGNNNIGGGKLNNSRGPAGNTPQYSTPNKGTFNRTPKNNTPNKSQPVYSPDRGNTNPKRAPSVPDRYQNNSGNNRISPSPSRSTSPPSNSGGSQRSGGTMQRTNK